MKIFIVLLIISLNVINFMRIHGDYSIDPFLNEIQSNGIYDLLKDIKYEFNDDVAIEVCLQIYQTNDCQKVVLNYIPPPEASEPESDSALSRRAGGYTEEQKREKFEKLNSTVYTYSNLIFTESIDVIIDKVKKKYPHLFGE